jgi:hypothetical protein
MGKVMHQAYNDKKRKEFIPACGTPWGKDGAVHATLNSKVTCKKCVALNRKRMSQ